MKPDDESSPSWTCPSTVNGAMNGDECWWAYDMSPLREGLWQGLSVDNESQICQVGVVFRDGQAHRSVGAGQQQDVVFTHEKSIIAEAIAAADPTIIVIEVRSVTLNASLCSGCCPWWVPLGATGLVASGCRLSEPHRPLRAHP